MNIRVTTYAPAHSLEGTLFSIFLFTIFVAPLPLGSNREWAWSLLESAVFILTAIWLYGHAHGRFAFNALVLKAKWSLYAFVGLIGWHALQLAPLPYTFVQLVAPHTAELKNLPHLAEGRFVSLSLDTYGTWQALLKTTLYFLVFAMTLQFVSNARRLRLLCYTLIASGVFQATYASLTLLGGLTTEFFGDAQTQTVATGTFVNRNHLAGFLELTLAVGVGLLVANLSARENVTWKQKSRAWLHTFLGTKIRLRSFLAVMVIALVLTHSRMGNTAFFSSLVLTSILAWLVLHLRRKRKNHDNSTRIHTGSIVVLVLSLIVIDTYIVGTWFGFDQVVERLEQTSLESESRVDVFNDALRMLDDFRLTGTGAGAFHTTFLMYQSGQHGPFYDHVHNDYVEFALELGLPGLVALGTIVFQSLAVAVIALVRRNSRLYRGMAFACIMGASSLLIHSFVDFNLRIPANAMYFTIVLALGFIARHGTHRSAQAPQEA